MNRTFCTRINDLLSDICNLLSGVTQGSVLGPLMFLIYINDIVELLARFNIKVKLFADDVKLYVKVAHQRANMIHRCFVSRNVNLLTRAYLTYVRPLLEYYMVPTCKS